MNNIYQRLLALTCLMVVILGLLTGYAGLAGREQARQWAKQLSEQGETLKERLDVNEQSAQVDQEEIFQLEAQQKAVTRQVVALKTKYALAATTGPGVRITLTDAPRSWVREGAYRWYILHDEDVKRVVNELLGGNAEAIAINGVRILAGTQIRCGGPVILVGDTPMTPPFVIEAIGNPQQLEQALTQPAQGTSGVYQQLSAFGIGFHIVASDMLELSEAVIPIGAITRARSENTGPQGIVGRQESTYGWIFVYEDVEIKK